MRAVNLLPADAQQRKLGAPPLLPTAGIAAAVVAASAVGVLARSESGTVAARRTTLAALQKQLAALSVTSGTADTAALQLLSSHDQRLAALNSALSTRVAYDRVLRQLALVLPDDVWLDGLTFGGAAGLSTTPTAAAPATPGAAPTSDTQITGATYTTDGVARFLQRLSVLPTLENVALQSTTLQQRGGKDVYAFTITADVVKGAGS